MLGATRVIPIHDENPTQSFSWLTVTLIIANVLVFFLEPSFGQPPAVTQTQQDVARTCAAAEFFYQWGMVPAEVTSGEPLAVDFSGCPPGTAVEDKSPYLSILTSMFVHGGWLHLIFNMLFLWVFGNNIEDRLGRIRYLLFYLVSGVLAALAHTFANPVSDVPTVGASGAIAGLLGAYLVLFPRARITTVVPLILLWPVVRLPAMVVLGFWFISQFFVANQPVDGGGVAWVAHVGGFVAGVLFIIPFGGRRRTRRRSPKVPPW